MYEVTENSVIHIDSVAADHSMWMTYMFWSCVTLGFSNSEYEMLSMQ
jgi:hypothetical protein